jgi:hypothetical protein
MNRTWKSMLLTAAGLLALPLVAWAQVALPVPPAPAAAPQPPELPQIVVGEGDGFFLQLPAPAPGAGDGAYFLAQAAAPNVIRVRQAQADPDQAGSEYWIGVQLEPMPELVKSQLRLERGMVVVQVFDDSPAAKADFKVNDIILRAGDKDIVQPEDLIHVVGEAKDKQLGIRVLRGGSETTIEVTPAKRQPDRVELHVTPETPHADVVARLEELYKRTPDGDVRLFALRPGGVFAYAGAAKFPGNLEVTIEKRGDKPATIRVKRIQDGKDQTWEVTEDKIDELPEDIRPHVQQMLGGQALAPPQQLGLRIVEAQARARDQATQAQAQVEAQKRQLKELFDRTQREYRVRVRPQPPGVGAFPQPPGAAPGAAVAPPTPAPPFAVSRAAAAGDAVQAKLDEILRRLDSPQGDAMKRLEEEVRRLRKDLEELRQEKK